MGRNRSGAWLALEPSARWLVASVLVFSSGAAGAAPPERVPRIRTEPVTVGPAISRPAIRRVIRRHSTEVRRCYEQALARDPALTGRITLRFTIAPDGSVPEASIRDSSLADPAVGACLVHEARRWRFPEPAGGGRIVVNYPFQFRPG